MMMMMMMMMMFLLYYYEINTVAVTPTLLTDVRVTCTCAVPPPPPPGQMWSSPLFNASLAGPLLSQQPYQYKLELYAFLKDMARFVPRSLDQPLTNTTRPAKLRLDCTKGEYASMLSGQVRTRQAASVNAITLLLLCTVLTVY